MADSLITVKKQDGNTRVQLGSSLDVASAGKLKSELGKIFRRKPPIGLDGSAVDRVDTAGLQVLLAFLAEGKSRDLAIHWVGASDTLRAASRLSGLSEKLELND